MKVRFCARIDGSRSQLLFIAREVRFQRVRHTCGKGSSAVKDRSGTTSVSVNMTVAPVGSELTVVATHLTLARTTSIQRDERNTPVTETFADGWYIFK